MTKENFRISIGAAVIATHFLCLIIIFYFKDEYIDRQGRISMALILMPVTASYVCAIVKSAVDRAEEKALAQKVNLNYSVIVGLFTAMTLIGLLGVVSMLEGAQETDKQVILLFETAFGAAFGLIATDLFGPEKRRLR